MHAEIRPQKFNDTHRSTIRTRWSRFAIFSIFSLYEKKKMKIENVDFIPDQSIVKLPTLSEGAVTAP